jgi:hypothetical protein
VIKIGVTPCEHSAMNGKDGAQLLTKFVEFKTRVCVQFLGTLAKLRKASVSFAIALCLSVRIEQLCCYSKDVNEILYLSIFSNI